ncbi:14 kDa phosphohistidine phosphatase-like [Actinia tenebrosa]|uniref:14 kDa phosphohistidine phosphatase-like n=1 Tax=Actinia tenebrosa TaxID=6105 RepID=A0A6P8IC43_ACTTE|nr:14 kDa phosphohistidine phosphatase-like [Actinia tenebrosa]
MADEARKKISAKLEAVPDVVIDSHGLFKYILIEVKDRNDDSLSKFVVRGNAKADYHADILEEVQPGIDGLGLSAVCVGGGRIEHNSAEKRILVYGYSMGFGRANHSITVEKLKKDYPNYKITYTNDGY